MNLDEATIDRLRELGIADDMLTWLAHPDAVRALLKLYVYAGWGELCQECGGAEGDSHLRSCAIAAAWRALGDPRGQADIERACEEAEWEDKRRYRERRMREAGLNASAASLGESPAAQWRRVVEENPLVREGEAYAVTFAEPHRGPSDAWLALPEATRRRFPYVDTSGAKKPK